MDPKLRQEVLALIDEMRRITDMFAPQPAPTPSLPAASETLEQRFRRESHEFDQGLQAIAGNYDRIVSPLYPHESREAQYKLDTLYSGLSDFWYKGGSADAYCKQLLAERNGAEYAELNRVRVAQFEQLNDLRDAAAHGQRRAKHRAYMDELPHVVHRRLAPLTVQGVRTREEVNYTMLGMGIPSTRQVEVLFRTDGYVLQEVVQDGAGRTQLRQTVLTTQPVKFPLKFR